MTSLDSVIAEIRKHAEHGVWTPPKMLTRWADAIQQTEAQLRAELATAQAFHDVAVAERNAAWREVDALKVNLATAQRERDEAQGVLSNLSSWLGAGMGDPATTGAMSYHDRIKWAIDHHISVQGEIAASSRTHALRAENGAQAREVDALRAQLATLTDLVRKDREARRAYDEVRDNYSYLAYAEADSRVLGARAALDAHPLDETKETTDVR